MKQPSLTIGFFLSLIFLMSCGNEIHENNRKFQGQSSQHSEDVIEEEEIDSPTTPPETSDVDREEKPTPADDPTRTPSFSPETEETPENIVIPDNQIVLQYLDGRSDGRPEKREQVKGLQVILIDLGYSITPDGYYGNDTVTVVAQFQTDIGLTVDGRIVNETTFNLMLTKIDELVAELDVFENLSSGEIRRGMENGKPLYWETEDHKRNFKTTYGLDHNYYRVYTDLWTIKEMNQTIDKLIALGVNGINHLGSYNYRVISGSNTPSRHSYGLAFDIIGFHMKDGTYLSILNDWDHQEKGAKLKNFRNVFCQHWDTVLSPDYNNAHKDHLHVDLNPSLRGQYEPASPTLNDVTSFKSLALAEGTVDYPLEAPTDQLTHEPIDHEHIEQLKSSEKGIGALANTRAFCR